LKEGRKEVLIFRRLSEPGKEECKDDQDHVERKNEFVSEPGKEGYKDDQDQVWRRIRGTIIYLLGNVRPILSILKSFLSWFKTKKGKL